METDTEKVIRILRKMFNDDLDRVKTFLLTPNINLKGASPYVKIMSGNARQVVEYLEFIGADQ